MTLAPLVAIALSSAAAAPPSTGPAPSDLRIGKLVLRISEAESAQVFHVVDQLSEWSEFCHRQYGRWAKKALPLTQADRELLAQHAKLRKARGWGNGFEQTFYADASIEEAFAAGVAAGVLTPAELKAERAILLHFAPKLRPLLESGRTVAARFRGRLEAQAAQHEVIVEKLARFAGVTQSVTIPVFLVPNPESGTGGGGYNGGRLVVEVQPDPDPAPVLLHEALHAFLEPRLDEIARAAQGANGLDAQSLSEGIAYALSPGLVSTAPRTTDELAETVARAVLRGARPDDVYVRFNLIALVLRPLLREVLEQGGTLADFLPLAVERWNEVNPRPSRQR